MIDRLVGSCQQVFVYHEVVNDMNSLYGNSGDAGKLSCQAVRDSDHSVRTVEKRGESAPKAAILSVGVPA